MKQETLEGAAFRLYPKKISDPYNPQEDLAKEDRDNFIKGAKWQEERIENKSEKLINELESLVKDNSLGEIYRAGITASIGRFKEWFEKFKKK
jgi:hypothetical protein